jgi:F-type H+-transporting ATPase subunit b
MLVVTAWATGWTVRAAAQTQKPVPHHVEGGAAREAAREGEEASPAPMNWVDFSSSTPPFIAMVINFGILATAYYLLGRKPIAAGLQSRRDSIAKEIEEAERMLAAAKERGKKYRAKHEALEEDKRLAHDAMIKAGEAERDRLIAEAEAKAERMRRDAEFLVEQEMKQVRADLLRETVESAVAAAEQLLRSRVTPADQERLAEEFLADLGGKKPAPAPSEREPRQAP